MHIIQAIEAQYQEPMIDAILKEFLKANDMRQNVFPLELSEDGQCVRSSLVTTTNCSLKKSTSRQSNL